MDLLGLLLLLGTGLLVFAGAVIAFTAWTLTHPTRRSYSWAVMRGVPGDPSEIRIAGARVSFSEWTFRSRGMELPVWDIVGLDAGGPIAVLTHGWGDSRVVALSRLPALLPACRRVIMWDLPGHGDSPGFCSMGTREADDLFALLERLAESDSAPVLLYGSSLGGGVSIVVAAASGTRSPIMGVIAEAPYRVPRVPAERVLAVRGLPFRWNLPAAMAILGTLFGYGLSWARRGNAGGFDRALHAAKLRVPLLVIHGSEDEVCPIEDGRAIAAAVPNELGRIVEIDGAAHNNLWADDRFIPTSAEAVAEFVSRACAATPAGGEGGRQPPLPIP